MKAAIYTRYGPPEVLHLAEVDRPTPRAGEVLVRVHASTVSAGTRWTRMGGFPGSVFFTLMLRLMFGLFRPRRTILGYEFSGVVVAVGADVQHYAPGQQVMGTTTMLRQGAYAEYVCIPQRPRHGVLAHKPAALTHAQAAALPIGGMTALQLVQRAGVRAGQRVLVYGASGSVGTYAVQLACHLGARVTGVCSGPNADMVLQLGAEQVLDYTQAGPAQWPGGYDVIVDAVSKLPAAQLKPLLRPGGRYVSVNTYLAERTELLELLAQWASSGAIKPVIDKVYPLTDIVAAHRYADQGHKRGNVVIAIADVQATVQ